MPANGFRGLAVLGFVGEGPRFQMILTRNQGWFFEVDYSRDFPAEVKEWEVMYWMPLPDLPHE
jgi:hypothetical protein